MYYTSTHTVHVYVHKVFFCHMLNFVISLGQRLRVWSRSGSHSESGATASVTVKKREWTETSETSQEEEGETGEGGQHPQAKRPAQGVGTAGQLRWVERRSLHTVNMNRGS